MAKHAKKWVGHVQKWSGHVKKWSGHVKDWRGRIKNKWRAGDEVSTVAALYHKVPIGYINK